LSQNKNDFFASARRAQKVKARLQGLWHQRGQKKVARLILPYANDPALDIQYEAVRMLGRLEDPIALPTLQNLAKRIGAPFRLDAGISEGMMLYPLAPIAVGRIKSHNLSGKRKIEVVVAELGLDFPALVRLSAQINRDGHAGFRPGNIVMEEVVDILYQQKKRRVAVDAMARALTLRSSQRTLLNTASLPPAQAAKVLLSYLAQARVAGGDEAAVVEYWENLGPMGRQVALPLVKQVLQQRPKKVSAWNMIPVLQSLARNGNREALSLLKSLRQDRDEFVGVLARRALEKLSK
jgi:hypothetical protein